MQTIQTSLMGNRVRMDYPHHWKFVTDAGVKRFEQEKCKSAYSYWNQTGIIVAVYVTESTDANTGAVINPKFVIEMNDGVLINANIRDFTVVDVGDFSHKS